MLCVVKNTSLNGFLLSNLPALGEKDVLVLSFGAVKCVDMNAELKGESDIFSRLTTLSRDKNVTILLHSDFYAAGGVFNSAAVVDNGICGVSDEINPRSCHDPGTAGRRHKLPRTLGKTCRLRAFGYILFYQNLPRGSLLLSGFPVQLRSLRRISRTQRLLFRLRSAA